MNYLHKLFISSLVTTATSLSWSASNHYHCDIKGCREQKVESVSSDYTATIYPIMFAEGLFSQGLQTAGLMTPLAQGGATVAQTAQSAGNSHYVKGEQLLKQMRTFMAVTGKTKVNLVGHSQGGFSARYVAGVVPAKVASVTLIGSPAWGSRLANLLNNMHPFFKIPLTKIIDVIFSFMQVGYNQKSVAALQGLSSLGSNSFSRRFGAGRADPCGQSWHQPAKNNVYYYSWGGSGRSYVDGFLADVYNKIVWNGQSTHDGLVGKCSAHWGRNLRDDYRLHHSELISSDEAISTLRTHANRLKNTGL